MISEEIERSEHLGELSLGRGRGYCLTDYEALRRFYQKSLSVGDVFRVIPTCWKIVRGAVECPSKRGRTKLTIKAQRHPALSLALSR
jgi:hypothetical protein